MHFYVVGGVMDSKDEMFLKVERSRERGKSFRAFCWGLATVGVVYCIMTNLAQMAGTSTSLNVLFQAITDLKINQWLGLVLSGGCGVWAFGERRFRKRETARLTNRIDLLEKKIDPEKETSGLTPFGNSQKEHR